MIERFFIEDYDLEPYDEDEVELLHEIQFRCKLQSESKDSFNNFDE